MKPHALAFAAVLTVVGVSAPVHAASAATVYVAPSGSDSASGTLAAPFATIQHAVAALPSGGGTVVVRGGTYAQRFSLHGVTDITVAAAAGEHPVLDGSTLKVPTGRSAVVDIADSTSVAVRGLEITGYRTSDIAAMPIGIYVHGGDTGVTISGDHVHAMGNDNGTLGSMDMNAHGIAAYGDSPTRSISGLTIDGNEVDHLKLGASESVVVNGNVDGWRITGNHIHDDNNIGIDAIGFEPTLPAAYRYTDLNRARNGVISGNDVENIISAGNPAYWSSGGWCNCADGLYVDGGTHIDIAGNTVRADDIGIEVAAENARGAADHVSVEGNAVSDSRYVGITTGGYCDGGRGLRGSADRDVVREHVHRQRAAEQQHGPRRLAGVPDPVPRERQPHHRQHDLRRRPRHHADRHGRPLDLRPGRRRRRKPVLGRRGGRHDGAVGLARYDLHGLRRLPSRDRIGRAQRFRCYLLMRRALTGGLGMGPPVSVA